MSLLFHYLVRQHKSCRWEAKRSVNDYYNGASFGDHCVLEENRVPTLKSHRRALEQEWHIFVD